MTMPETIRLSEVAKRRLVQVKRRTGIDQWNILCRWALCVSLSDLSTPRITDEDGRASNVELTWKTFVGPYSAVLEAVLIQRLKVEKTDLTEISSEEYLYAHLYRGISILANNSDLQSIEHLLRLPVIADNQRGVAGTR